MGGSGSRRHLIAGILLAAVAAALLVAAVHGAASAIPGESFQLDRLATEARLQNRGPGGMSTTDLYHLAGNWSTLWWLPEEGNVPVRGKQIAVKGASTMLPHLIFAPHESPQVAPRGLPMIVFLHGQGESSPSPLPNVALQG